MLAKVNKKVFFAAIVLLIAFQWFYYRSNKSYRAQRDEKAAAQSQDGAAADSTKSGGKKMLQEQKVNKLYLLDAKKNVKESELWSEVAHKGMGSSLWTLDGVKAQIYSEKVTYTVTGERGKADDITKSMNIEGKVQLVSSNGYHFYTEHLDYDPISKKITSPDKISVEGPREKDGRLYLEGYGLAVDLASNSMIIQNRVKGFKPMSDNRVMNISSQTGEFSAKQQAVTFRNNVVIKVDPTVVRGNLAQFRYKDNKLDTLHMDGGIHMMDADKSGSAGEAIVFFNEDKYIFRKKPFLTQQENALIGDEIIVYNGGKRVQVKKAKVEYYQDEKNGKPETKK